MRQILGQLTDVAKRFSLRCANHWGQQPLFDGNGNPEIHIRILHNCIAIERGVHSRHFGCGLYRRFQDKIVHGDFRRVGSFTSGLQFFARFHERPRIDIDREIKMRNRTEAFGEPLRNDFAHSGKLYAPAFTSSN